MSIELPKMRQEFEKWHGGEQSYDLAKFNKSGKYVMHETHTAWLAWQEAARLALEKIPRSSVLAIGLAIDALENEPPEGRDWPVNWPLIVHGLKEVRDAIRALAAPGAGKETAG